MRTERRTVRMGNDGQLVYGMEITLDYRRDNTSRLKSFHSFFYGYAVPFLALTHIIASATFLVLYKHEQPHMPLRTWIYGIVSVAAAALALSIWDFSYHKCFAEMLSTYDFDMILDGKTPVTGCDLYAIRFCTRAETPLDWLRFAYAGFKWVWLIIGCLWIWKESSFRLDAPRLFWLSMSLATSTGVECTTQLFISAAGCYYDI